MAIMVKMNNGDIERFPDSMTFELTGDMALFLHDGDGKVTAMFAPGGWAGVFHEENVVRRHRAGRDSVDGSLAGRVWTTPGGGAPGDGVFAR